MSHLKHFWLRQLTYIAVYIWLAWLSEIQRYMWGDGCTPEFSL